MVLQNCIYCMIPNWYVSVAVHITQEKRLKLYILQNASCNYLKVWGLRTIFIFFIHFCILHFFNHVLIFKIFLVIKKCIIWPSNSTPRYISKRNEHIRSPKDLYTSVHSCLVHNILPLEETQMSNWWMNKQNVVYPYNGILLINEKGAKYWYLLHHRCTSETLC